jgi:hypothetical protein
MAASGLKGQITVSNPENLDEFFAKGKTEIRGGNRPADYIPDPDEHGDIEVVFEAVEDDTADPAGA